MASDIAPAEEDGIPIRKVRGRRVMLDHHLAHLYGVSTGRLNEQVRRNLDRFPPDFAFQLSRSEMHNLISQFAISSWGGLRKLPWAFTEHGAVMAASVLNTPIAVQASVAVVRAFIRLREILSGDRDLARRLDELEARYDGQFRTVFAAIRQIMEGPGEDPKREKIGFRP